MVSVLIPRPLLADVYELVVQRERGDEPTGSNEGSEEPDDTLIRRMWDESEPAHQALMTYMAEHPDEWLHTAEIAQALDLEHGAKSAAGSFGAFGRRSAHRYGGAKPWHKAWDHARGENRYMMPGRIARIIQSL